MTRLETVCKCAARRHEKIHVSRCCLFLYKSDSQLSLGFKRYIRNWPGNPRSDLTHLLAQKSHLCTATYQDFEKG